MQKSSREIYTSELEELTGKIFMGDITPLVFDLIKDSLFKEELIKELTGEEFSIPKENNVEVVKSVEDFDSWFSSFKRLV